MHAGVNKVHTSVKRRFCCNIFFPDILPLLHQWEMLCKFEKGVYFSPLLSSKFWAAGIFLFRWSSYYILSTEGTRETLCECFDGKDQPVVEFTVTLCDVKVVIIQIMLADTISVMHKRIQRKKFIFPYPRTPVCLWKLVFIMEMLWK